MYKADILTTSVNLAGLPAISVPAGLGTGKLPIGLQVTSPAFSEGHLLSLVNWLATVPQFHIELPEEIQ